MPHPARVLMTHAPVIEFEYVRGVRRPLLAMMRGDDAAAALGQPVVETPCQIRARRAIEPRERFVEQRERGSRAQARANKMRRAWP